MKKYTTLGELLIDYRDNEGISQLDLATKLDVDVRTIQRWEKNITLVKPDKEEDLVMETLLPYQLIRNLNALIAIPTYYDFRIRKYSLSHRTTKLPSAFDLVGEIDLSTNLVRTMDRGDLKYVKRFMSLNKDNSDQLSDDVILKAVKYLPEMNVVIVDESGYYSGHFLVFPISVDARDRLKNRELKKCDLTVDDIVDYTKVDEVCFFTYDVSADCNETIYYLVVNNLRFLKEKRHLNYYYSSIPSRYDSFDINKDAGLTIVWTDEENPNIRYHEGNFDFYLFGGK